MRSSRRSEAPRSFGKIDRLLARSRKDGSIAVDILSEVLGVPELDSVEEMARYYAGIGMLVETISEVRATRKLLETLNKNFAYFVKAWAKRKR